MQGQASVFIAAPPESVYALVSDVTRMGEWSPECIHCEWIEGATGPAVGSKFKGTNKLGPYKWSTTPTVTEAQPGRLFEFDAGATTWRYEFAPADGGTQVTESFLVTSRATKVYSSFLFGRVNKMTKGMLTTLERIKAVAEV